MELIRQAILNTFEHLQPDSTRPPHLQNLEAVVRKRCGLNVLITRVLLDYRGEGFLTDYEFQGREYRTFWAFSQ